ncbi:MAG: bifunctional oligoribonuclease/PAP phosphatase NrnA [Candidatus Andersenbacteria bacterium]|nr:bifunctional oligoribonuclease/PAP phosphatase NrnA [Candidatus Andersenbacteria bacterium]
MQQAVNLIKSSESILILTHKNPDGDAVGSVLGLAQALESIGKNVKCFSKDAVPDVFGFLPNVSKIKDQTVPEKYDLVILLDCALFDRTGINNINEITFSFNNLLIIDHHPKGETECDHYEKCIFVIDAEMSSTAVLIYKLLKKADIEITKNIANCLLTGIFTDTGGFQHSNTDSQSLEAAAEFMKKGSRVDKITKNIFSSKSVAAIKLWGVALSRIKTDPETGMAVSYVSKRDLEDFGVKEDDLSGLVNVINTVSDAKFSLLLTEFEDCKIKGSLRSEEYNGIDVSRIARSLGGGGHKLASGFEMNGNLKNNVAKISEMIAKANKK